MDALHDKYGNNPDRQIIQRINEEWGAINQISLIKEISFLYEFTSWLRKEKYPYLLLDESAGSFILYLKVVYASSRESMTTPCSINCADRSPLMTAELGHLSGAKCTIKSPG